MSLLSIDTLSVPLTIKTALIALSQKYTIERAVMKGANGHLFFGTNRILSTSVAIKFYYWGSDRRFHAEPQLLAEIKSPNVISVHDAGYIDHQWAYFVTPLCANGDLDDLLSRTDIGNLKAVNITAQILNGLSYLHAQRLIHRDLKPANIYLHEDNTAVIGDFGSIKRLPVGQSAIPASNHAIIYRPPESISTREFGFSGDVYQVGIVLYQLLGGYLPYDETAWLSKKELAHYEQLADSTDRTIFADQCIHNRIRKGKVIDINTLGPWVPDALRKVVRKACHLDKNSRFASPADFMAKLNEIRPEIKDWSLVDGYPTLNSATRYRIITEGSELRVQKQRDSDQWRLDTSVRSNILSDIIAEINARV